MILFDKLQDRKYYDGFFVCNYADKFESTVTKLLALKDNEGNPPPINVRMNIIDALFDAYVNQTRMQPNGAQVQRLANWILLEDLTDGRPDKVTLTAYPFLTKRQLRTRYRRERADEDIPLRLTEQQYLGGKKTPIFFHKDN